jgi:type 1 glutamine amidotransferase
MKKLPQLSFALSCLVTGTLLLTACASDKSAVTQRLGNKKKVLFFSKSAGFEHSTIKRSKGEPAYAEKILQQLAATNNFEFDFTYAKDGTVFTPEKIRQYDAFFFYTTGDLTEAGKDGNPPMSVAGKEAFLDAIAKGKGFIGVHSASDTFHSPGNKDHGPERFQLDGDKADPYVKMLGTEFILHGSQQPGHLICVDSKFPGCANFPTDFAPREEWYSLKDFPADTHVILVQDTTQMHDSMYQRPNYPETWARKHGKGRVFYSSMGHREDIWTNSVFQQVLIGGINWAVKNIDADITPNIQKVTPQANTMPPMK